MKRNLKYIVPGFLVIAVALVLVFRARSGDASGGRRQNVPNVAVNLPQRRSMTSILEFTGDLVAIQQATIFSKVSGNLEFLAVDLGTTVRRNQLLALIDTTELYQMYQQTRATYENTREVYQRNLALLKNSLVSKQDVDNAGTAMKVAKASFENAATRLGYANIRAPFPGIITRRFVDPGANITSNNSTLFQLMDMDSMRAFVNVLEKDIPLVSQGKKAVVRVDAYPGKFFDGVISRISQAVDLATRTMAVQVDVPNRGLLLKPGMFANVTLVVAEHANALTVPTEAILRDDDGTFVFAAENGVAHMVRVQTGIARSDLTEILSGISDSTSIITTGQQFVRPDGPISVK